MNAGPTSIHLAPDDHPWLAEAGNSTESAGRRGAGDEILFDALAAGLSYEAAGELAGVSARTVRRRMGEVDFAAEVARRRSQRVQVVSGRLTGLCDRALDVIGEALEADRMAERLRAAELVLGLERRYRAEIDVAARLVAVEQALNFHTDNGGPVGGSGDE